MSFWALKCYYVENSIRLTHFMSTDILTAKYLYPERRHKINELKFLLFCDFLESKKDLI